MERQCKNACRSQGWLASHPKVERVNFLANPSTPESRRRFTTSSAEGIRSNGSFDLKNAAQERGCSPGWIDLKLVVRLPPRWATTYHGSLSRDESHRELSPNNASGMGIRDNPAAFAQWAFEAAEIVLADPEHSFG